MRGGWCGVEEIKDSGRVRRGLDKFEGGGGGGGGECIVDMVSEVR